MYSLDTKSNWKCTTNANLSKSSPYNPLSIPMVGYSEKNTKPKLAIWCGHKRSRIVQICGTCRFHTLHICIEKQEICHTKSRLFCVEAAFFLLSAFGCWCFIFACHADILDYFRNWIEHTGPAFIIWTILVPDFSLRATLFITYRCAPIIIIPSKTETALFLFYARPMNICPPPHYHTTHASAAHTSLKI